jgi:hypothetical protein
LHLTTKLQPNMIEHFFRTPLLIIPAHLYLFHGTSTLLSVTSAPCPGCGAVILLSETQPSHCMRLGIGTDRHLPVCGYGTPLFSLWSLRLLVRVVAPPPPQPQHICLLVYAAVPTVPPYVTYNSLSMLQHGYLLVHNTCTSLPRCS